jgi:carboxylesterase type B
MAMTMAYLMQQNSGESRKAENAYTEWPRPTVITAPEACEMDQSFIQKTIPHDPFVVSDLDGLNLNIVVPQTNHAQDLPVFVYIHGGGFGVGSNSWPQLDISRFVEFSAKLGSPVIGVAIK